MKRNWFVAMALLLLLLPLTGCGEEKGTELSKTEEEKFRAPLGQPMPPEAKAAMERANQQAPPQSAPR
ncbi:MAG: hypothetical protein OHK0029_28280 [Armatimonadaceae bacterium]